MFPLELVKSNERHLGKNLKVKNIQVQYFWNIYVQVISFTLLWLFLLYTEKFENG